MSSKSEATDSKEVAHQDWKTLIPFRCIPRDKKKEIPVEHVGLVSFLLYAWLEGFMWKAFRGRIDRSHLWTCPEIDSGHINANRLEKLWRDEIKKHGTSGASLSRVFIRFCRRRWLIGVLMLVVSISLLFFSVAYIMMSIMRLTTSEEVELWQGLVLVASLFLASILSQILFIGSVTLAQVGGGRLRAGILCLLFRKLMKVSSIQDKTIGKVVNLFSNDGIRVYDGAGTSHMMLSGPMLAIGSTAYAIYLLGPWALIGLAVLLMLLPIQMTAGKIFMKFRGQAILLTDTRVRMMTEYLANIRFIKMYSWEKALIKMVEGARAAEQKILEKANIAMSLLLMTSSILVSIATMCTLIAYTMSGNHLSSAQGFMYLLIYTCIQDKLELCMMSLKMFSEFSVAAKRFQEILLLDDSECTQSDCYRIQEGIYALELHDLTFRWPRVKPELLADETTHPSAAPSAKQSKSNGNDDVAKSLQDQEEVEMPLVSNEEQQTFGHFNLTIEKGQVVGIMGPVSSGKTSLIRALLGQMNVVQGNIQISGSLAYVAQQPWIFNATVRDNILLGSVHEPGRYKIILELCCLTEDLASLVNGDMTEIGERGVTLSGGQKQRISLARALYSDRDIYLFDDPLASVDPDVAENIFNKVIIGHLLGKTVLLVTHQIKFLSKCDLVVRLNDRQLLEVGSHEELMRNSNDYASVINEDALSHNAQNRLSGKASPEPLNVSLPSSLSTPPIVSASKQLMAQDSTKNSLLEMEKSMALMKEEEKAEGSVSMGTYLAYMQAGGGLPILVVIIIVSILAELSRAFSVWWLAHWLEDGGGDTVIFDNSTNTTTFSDNIADNPLLWMYNLVYGMSLIAILLFFSLRSVIIVKALIRASSGLHDQLLCKVMRTSVLFFDTTPLGRLINRFSRDMDEMDSKLPVLIESSLKSFLNILIYLALIAAIMPWFLVAIPFIILLFSLLYLVFRAGVRELQRLQLIAMSPLLSQVDATVRGLSSIQAYDKVTDFEVRFRDLLDHSTITVFLSHFAARWVGIRLSFITTSLVSCTALLIFLLREEIPTAYSGAAIIYAFQLLSLFQFFVRFAVDAGATFASTERIHSYTKEMHEEGPLLTKTFALPKGWPSKGQIQFTNLNLSYREGLPPVLKGVSFLVMPNEKIGIVGRTGSGKSSLVGALFRLTEASGGKMEIDEIDIALIGLEELRTKLSIIPQDPVLFSGNIRTNLDPFHRHIDHELWHALERCHLKDKVSQMEGQLSAKVMENGENLSQGERQLLCMARVLLRHTKIIILDEATASLDNETEAKIEKTINETFNECTVLIIAHRLRTVLRCNRVLVLDEGKVVEFDQPSNLLANPDSRLSQMVSVAESGASEVSPLEAVGSLAWV